MTKESLKTGLIVVLLIATVVLFRQYYIYKVQVEICDLHSVQLEFYSARNFMESAENENEWEMGANWIFFANQAFPTYPQGEVAQRVLEVCKALPNLEYGSKEYEEAKALLTTKVVVQGKFSPHEAYLTIDDEDSFEQLEEILGIQQ